MALRLVAPQRLSELYIAVAFHMHASGTTALPHGRLHRCNLQLVKIGRLHRTDLRLKNTARMRVHLHPRHRNHEHHSTNKAQSTGSSARSILAIAVDAREITLDSVCWCVLYNYYSCAEIVLHVHVHESPYHASLSPTKI